MWQFIKREPLVHFLGIAVLLFVANAIFSGDQREVIKVDAVTRDFLVQERQELVLRALTEQEKQEVVENFIEDEILVREARRRGFANSSRVRQLLLQNMRFFMSSEIPEPTDQDLRTFFSAHTEKFASRPGFTYEHVFFSDPDNVPPDTLEILRDGADFRQVGESSANITRRDKADESQIVAAFGREQSRKIIESQDDQWNGPFLSAQGAHFIRIVKRTPSVVPTFEEVQSWLYQDWMISKNQELLEREMTILRKKYQVEVDASEQDGK